MRRFFRYWLPPLVWMGLIFLLSSRPSLPSLPGGWDVLLKKTGHVVVYGVLTWLYWRALRQHFRASTVLRVVCIGLAVAYGLSDEYHQTFVLGRNGTLLDVVVDGVGACGAMLLDRRLERRRVLARQVSALQ